MGKGVWACDPCRAEESNSGSAYLRHPELSPPTYGYPWPCPSPGSPCPVTCRFKHVRPCPLTQLRTMQGCHSSSSLRSGQRPPCEYEAQLLPLPRPASCPPQEHAPVTSSPEYASWKPSCSPQTGMEREGTLSRGHSLGRGRTGVRWGSETGVGRRTG